MSSTLFSTPQENRLAHPPVRSLIDTALFMRRMVDHTCGGHGPNRILRSLSKEQLADIGLDSSMIRVGP